MEIVIDVETTGLPSKRNAQFRDTEAYQNARVVSCAWVVLDRNRRIDRQYHIIRPNGFVIPNDSIKIHGITNEFAKQVGISIEQCIVHLRETFHEHNIVRFVAHNVYFDFNILLSEFYQNKKANDMISNFFQIERFCTMMHGKQFLKVKKFPKLTELYSILTKRDMKNAHNAAADVEACCCCFKILRQKRRRHSI